MPPSSYHDYARITESASDPQIIDDFEDGDLSEYSGATSYYAVTSNQVAEGSFSLEHDGQTGATREIVSDFGLPTYPGYGDTFEWKLYLPTATSDSNSDMIFKFATDAGGSSGVFSNFRPAVDDMQINSGGNVGAATVDWSQHTGEWLTVRYDYSAPVVMTLLDSGGSQIAQASATYGSTQKDGGILIGAQENTRKYYTDIIKII